MVRRAFIALVVLTVAGCSGGRDKLIADLQNVRPEVRALAVKKLAERFDPDDVSLFTQAARDPVSIVRAEAMVALGKSQDPRVVDLLAEALGDSDEQVQRNAAASLATLKTDKARTYLSLQYARRGRSTRMAIVQALKGVNIPGAMASVVAAEASSIWDRNAKVLTDGTLPERVGAAEELGRSGRPDAVNKLVPLLKGNQVVLAAAAARGLGYAKDVRAVPALLPLLDENYPELRESACDALARLKDPSALPKLVAAAQEKSPASALAVRAIISLPQTAETDRALCELVLSASDAQLTTIGREMRKRGGCPPEPLLEKLKSPSTQPQALAALAALAPAGGEWVAKVSPLLTSSDAAIRKLAVDALADLGDAAAGPAILKAWDAEVKALEPVRADWVPAALPKTWGSGFNPDLPLPESDPAAIVRMRTTDLMKKVQALDEQRAKDSGKVLLQAPPPREVVDDTTEEEVKVLAALVRALGKLKLEGAKDKVEPFTRESSVLLRSAAFSALAFLGGDAKRGLFDTERAVQSATAQALVEAGPAGQLVVIGALAELSGDRSRLLEPLRGVVPPKEGATALAGLVKEGGAEAGIAAQLLADMQATESMPVLLSALDDATLVARREVLFALGRMKDHRGLDAVAKDLYSDSAEVRAAAATALSALGAGAHLEAIDALRGDYYLSVRDAAEAATQKLKGGEGKP